MSNYTGDYKYPDTFSFGTTRMWSDNLRRERDGEKLEELKKELKHEDKTDKR